MGLPSGITLNIIAHELEALGSVSVQAADPAREVLDVRGWTGEMQSPDFLYVFNPEFCETVPPEGCMLLCLEGEDTPQGASIVLYAECSPFQVLTRLHALLYRYGEWERTMDSLLLNGCTVQDLVDVSEGFLVNHVVVVDPAMKLVGCTWNTPCDDPVTNELMAHGYHTDENIKKFKLNRRFGPWANTDGFIINDTRRICSYTTAVYSFKTDVGCLLIAVMMCNNVAPDPWMLDVFGIFLTRLGHLAQREYSIVKPSGNVADSFIRDLLAGDLVEREAIEERAEFAEIPVDGKFCLFCLATNGGDQGPVARIIAEVAQKTAPAKVLYFEGNIVVLCFNCRSRSVECPRGCRMCALDCPSRVCTQISMSSTVVSRLEAVTGSYGLVCGRSSTFASLTQARRAYLQARTAAEVAGGDADVQTPITGVRNFDDVFLEFMVRESVVGGEDIVLATSTCNMLRSMRERDAEQGTDDYEVLRAYLAQERHAVQAAEALHMHRNSLRYRIDRIVERYGLDLDDSRTRADLCVSFFLLGSAPDSELAVPFAQEGGGKERQSER